MQSAKNKYTAKQVLNSYIRKKFDEEIQEMWGVVVFYRWISIIITPLFIRASIAPTKVTLFSLLLTLSQPVCLLLETPASYLYLGIICYVFNILDCVDGDIARTTDTYSRLGQYSDFQVDVAHRIMTYITLGLLLQLQPDTIVPVLQHYALLIASIACLLAVGARLSRLYVAVTFNTLNTVTKQTKNPSFIVKLEKAIFSFLSGLDFCLPVLILIAGIFDKLPWLLIWLLIYSTMDFIYTQYTNYFNLR